MERGVGMERVMRMERGMRIGEGDNGVDEWGWMEK